MILLLVASAVGVPGGMAEVLPQPARGHLGAYGIVGSRPHDPEAFTQGLTFRDGRLYESTGLYGKSTLRRVDPRTGSVLQSVAVPPRYFAEGITILGNRIYLLTWREETCLVYDDTTLEPVGELHFDGEGWGLTDDGESLIRSDGTDVIRFHDPATFREIRRIHVRESGMPVGNLNELEYIRGEVYAAVWMSDRIVRIDPETGKVKGSVVLGDLFPAAERPDPRAFLNGIAYDRERDRIFVTGKFWPRVFEFGRR